MSPLNPSLASLSAVSPGFFPPITLPGNFKLKLSLMAMIFSNIPMDPFLRQRQRSPPLMTLQWQFRILLIKLGVAKTVLYMVLSSPLYPLKWPPWCLKQRHPMISGLFSNAPMPRHHPAVTFDSWKSVSTWHPKVPNPSPPTCILWSKLLISLHHLALLSPLKTWLTMSYVVSTTAIELSLMASMQGTLPFFFMTFSRSFSFMNSLLLLFNGRFLLPWQPCMHMLDPTIMIKLGMANFLYPQLHALATANRFLVAANGAMSRAMFCLSVSPSNSSTLVSHRLLVPLLLPLDRFRSILQLFMLVIARTDIKSLLPIWLSLRQLFVESI